MQGLLNRHLGLKTKMQFTVDSVRVNRATTNVIRSWFSKLEVPEITAIKPENRWNMDEAGIMEGQCHGPGPSWLRASLRLAPGQSPVYKALLSFPSSVCSLFSSL
jgi:hypothetical protein